MRSLSLAVWWQVGSLGKGEVVEATETRGPDAAGVTRVQFKRVKCAPTSSSSLWSLD